MSDYLYLLLLGLFLPLFPMSVVFNTLLVRLPHPLWRGLLLLLWPQIGLLLAISLDLILPPWLVYWVLFTSVLYAFRLLAQREVHRWIGFLATSLWSLNGLFIIAAHTTSSDGFVDLLSLLGYTFLISIPLVILSLLATHLTRHFGAAYTGLYAGLAKTMPHFSIILIVSMLAATATPLFPSFFLMLAHLLQASHQAALHVILTLLILWILWSWSGMRLLQGLIIGNSDPAHLAQNKDLSQRETILYMTVLGLLLISGLFFAGGLL